LNLLTFFSRSKVIRNFSINRELCTNGQTQKNPEVEAVGPENAVKTSNPSPNTSQEPLKQTTNEDVSSKNNKNNEKTDNTNNNEKKRNPLSQTNALAGNLTVYIYIHFVV
jgi:hypothetical protein